MKPALRYWFVFDFYEHEHDRLPGHDISGRKRLRKKRRAVIERWWKRLPTARRNALIAEAERIIATWNDSIRRNRIKLQQHIDEIQERIDEHKRKERHA